MSAAYYSVDCTRPGCGGAFSVPIGTVPTSTRCYWCEIGKRPEELAGEFDAAIAAMPWPHLEQQTQAQVAA